MNTTAPLAIQILLEGKPKIQKPVKVKHRHPPARVTYPRGWPLPLQVCYPRLQACNSSNKRNTCNSRRVKLAKMYIPQICII